MDERLFPTQAPKLASSSPVEADPELDLVLARLIELAQPEPVELFGTALRQSIDEVLDGPRTGRWSFDQLEKTEKTYVGTKLEIVVRTALGLERGPLLDLEVAGVPVDVKWAMNSSWQIPMEAVGQLCLCIGGMRGMTHFVVGLIRCEERFLNPGGNRDRKRTISRLGKGSLKFLVLPTLIPPNFVAEMDPTIRGQVFAGDSIQSRVTKLFRLLPRRPIPRDAIATVAQTTGDPMRRARRDQFAGDPLEGMCVLSGKYGNRVIEALGYPLLDKNEFMSIPRVEVESLSSEERAALPTSTLERLGLT